MRDKFLILISISISAVLALPTDAAAQSKPDAVANKALITKVLSTAVASHKVPNVVAIVVRGDQTVYSGAFGSLSDSGGVPVSDDTIFRVASMTKPVTAVAVMQLVEAGKLGLDEQASKYLPAIGRAQVLDHIDTKTGQPVFRAPKTPVTIRELLSHTSGYGYARWDATLNDYRNKVLASGVSAANFKEPLMFDPGTRWEYGTSLTWLGRIVEAVSGETLEQYFQEHIFAPLKMNDSSFIVPAAKAGRLVTLHQRKTDGSLVEVNQNRMSHPAFFDGGGGLTSTPHDYATFIEMLLGGGELHGVRLLKAATVREMETNQIGDINLHPFKTTNPAQSADGSLPGDLDKYGLGMAISSHGESGGRAPGSVAWAGLEDTFFWIDPHNNLGAVIMMQMLPFLDPAPTSVFQDFEHAVYAPSTPSTR